jgi:DNA (cytosine-5)-methyltransferase 1
MASYTYYNEISPYCVEWLERLMVAGHIPDGFVDSRSIEDVKPEDLREFTQCHFFAGLGGWSYALRLAGWPDDHPVWTGSCPCQPFSQAGKGYGFADERHLWPAFHHLIRVCRPVTCFGEQVASPDGLAWLDLVASDLEGENYAVRAIDSCSAGVGSPQIRQRLYWLASAGRAGLPLCECKELLGAGWGREGRAVEQRGCALVGPGQPGPTNSFWGNVDWLRCRDAKWRPVEAGSFPLAHGVSGRVGRLRAYGNSINPWQAAEIIKAYMSLTE